MQKHGKFPADTRWSARNDRCFPHSTAFVEYFRIDPRPFRTLFYILYCTKFPFLCQEGFFRCSFRACWVVSTRPNIYCPPFQILQLFEMAGNIIDLLGNWRTTADKIFCRMASSSSLTGASQPASSSLHCHPCTANLLPSAALQFPRRSNYFYVKKEWFLMLCFEDYYEILALNKMLFEDSFWKNRAALRGCPVLLSKQLR